MRLHKTVESLSRALDSLHRPGQEIRGSAAGASALRRKKCVKGSGGTWCVMGCTYLSERSRETRSSCASGTLTWLGAE